MAIWNQYMDEYGKIDDMEILLDQTSYFLQNIWKIKYEINDVDYPRSNFRKNEDIFEITFE